MGKENSSVRNDRLPSLTALRAFESAARQGSAKRAAEELSVTPTAISHQVRQLEDALGLPLVSRTPRRLGLTPPARLLQINGLKTDAVLRPGMVLELDGDAD